jgi:pSer/pThr/pTyr-binding forkhead associated (FHA) protein
MASIIVRYLSGSRSGQFDLFDAETFQELLVGRDPSAQIRFDSDQDDLVSRQHIRIARDVIDPEAFQVVDLESRNGCFLNRRRVFGSVRVAHGDVIELGMGGPKFRFELDPPPDMSGLPTRDIAAGMTEMGGAITSDRNLPTELGGGGSRPVGKATVERIVGETFSRVHGQSRRMTWIIGAGLVVLAVIGWLTWNSVMRVSEETQAVRTSTEERLRETQKEIAKNPALIESMRQEIVALQEQIRLADERSEQSVKELTGIVRRTEANQAKQAKMLAQKSGPADDEFMAIKAKWKQLNDQERYQEALDVGQTLIAMNSNRYEGYASSGITLYFLKEYARAGSLLQQAANKAPVEQKQQLASLAKQCQQLLEGSARPR